MEGRDNGRAQAKIKKIAESAYQVFGSTQAHLETCKAPATALYDNEHDVGEALAVLFVALPCRFIRQ